MVMDFGHILQKAGHHTARLLPYEANKLRWLYQTCGKWSDPSTKEVSKREIITRVFAFATVPMALLYSAYFFARGFFQSATCILNGRIRNASSIFVEDNGKAIKCLVLTVTNIAYAFLGLAKGHDVFKCFIPPPLEKRDTQELMETWDSLKKKLEKTQQEIEKLDQKMKILQKEHTELERDCQEEKEEFKKYEIEVAAKKMEVENYQCQIRELEMALSSLNAAAALRKEIAEKNLELDFKNKEIEEKQKSLNDNKSLIENLTLANHKFEDELRKLEEHNRSLKEKLVDSESKNEVLLDKGHQLQQTIDMQNAQIEKLTDQLDEDTFFDAEDHDDFEIPPVKKALDNKISASVKSSEASDDAFFFEADDNGGLEDLPKSLSRDEAKPASTETTNISCSNSHLLTMPPTFISDNLVYATN
jgi:hypothetical protein